jgi:hypothetical protein
MTYPSIFTDRAAEQLRLHEQARALAPGLRRVAIESFWQALGAQTQRWGQQTGRAATRLRQRLAQHARLRGWPEA